MLIMDRHRDQKQCMSVKGLVYETHRAWHLRPSNPFAANNLVPTDSIAIMANVRVNHCQPKKNKKESVITSSHRPLYSQWFH
jgi:hypothetical protein